MALEIERKYLNVDLEEMRHRLSSLNAHCTGKHFESNWVFDTPQQDLFKSKRLLRLRRQEWSNAIHHILTLKLPVTGSISLLNYKVGEELEIEVSDPFVTSSILASLGYTVYARYEKVREPWQLNGVEIELDILPFASVLEMEGTESSIELAAADLRLDDISISTKNYHQLNQEWREQQGLPFESSFVFTAEIRKKLRQSLGLSLDVPDLLKPDGVRT